MAINKMRRVLTVWLAFTIVSQTFGDTLAEAVRRGVTLRNARIPVYSHSSQQFEGFVRLDSARMDYKQHGFFRIGLLPVAALDGVTFEARQPELFADALADASKTLGKNADVRRVKIIFSPTRILEAGRVQFLSSDEWRLWGGVRLVTGGQEVNSARGTLWLGGEQAGQLILETPLHAVTKFQFITK
jgi:hypothetical protein